MQTPAVIFDMDGIIIDSEPLHARVKLLVFRHFGIPFREEELKDFVGRTSKDMFSEVLAREGRGDIALEEIVRYKHEAYLRELEEGAVPVVEGTLPLIRRLHGEGKRLALATSSWDRVMEAVLDRFDLRECFDSVLSGSTLPRSKPDPAIYNLSAKRLGVEPAACTVIEDSASGILAAKRAGMQVVAYRNPNSGNQDLTLADRVVDSMTEL